MVMDALWGTGVVDLRQRRVDCLRHADDQIQAGFAQNLPEPPRRNDHRDLGPFFPGAPHDADQSAQSGAVDEVHARQVDDETRFTEAQADGSSERRERLVSRSPTGRQMAVEFLVAISTSSMGFDSFSVDATI
jgi:hypothetical protein